MRIEDYVTTYMASGGDEFQTLEAVGQEILLPYVSFLDYFKDNKNYSSFIEQTIASAKRQMRFCVTLKYRKLVRYDV